MKNAVLLLALLAGFRLAAQAPDAGRMTRDIEVAENVLASVFQELHTNTVYSTTAVVSAGVSGVEGTYLDGFGVLFTLSRNDRALALTGTYLRSAIAAGVRKGVTIISTDEAESSNQSPKNKKTADTLSMEQFFRDAATRFFADYAFVLRQLPDNEKIMIRFGSSYSPGSHGGQNLALYLNGSEREQGYSATVKKADVNALQAGTITREQFEKRIEFTSQKNQPAEADRDLVLLSNILSGIYDRDMDEVFWMSGTPKLERIPGIGAVYYINIWSRNFRYVRGSRNGLSPVIVEGLSATSPAREESQEDLTARLDSIYPVFLEELKHNMVEYGSIVKSLAPGEALIFQVTLFDCEPCKRMPEKLEITARQSTLDSYRKGSLTLRDAVAQLKLVEKQQD